MGSASCTQSSRHRQGSLLPVYISNMCLMDVVSLNILYGTLCIVCDTSQILVFSSLPLLMYYWASSSYGVYGWTCPVHRHVLSNPLKHKYSSIKGTTDNLPTAWRDISSGKCCYTLSETAFWAIHWTASRVLRHTRNTWYQLNIDIITSPV